MSTSVAVVARKIGSSLREQGLAGTFKKCVAEIEELKFDRRFNVETVAEPWRSEHTPGEARDYFPTKITVFREIFSRLPLPYEQFTFLDVGSGKGKVLFLASNLPFRRIVGLELLPELHEVAERNIRSYRNPAQRCTEIQSVCADATTYPLPNENTVIFLFNPFKCSGVSRFLDTLGRSLQEHPREIYLVYNTAFCGSLMEDCGFLQGLVAERSYSIFRNNIGAGTVQNSTRPIPPVPLSTVTE